MTRSPHAPAPLPNSYWVLPGQLLAGEYPGGRSQEETRARLARLEAAGIDCFVDLTAASEREPYDRDPLFRAEYIRKPIQDHGLPERPENMTQILEAVEGALRAGRRLYVHCRAGIGRTGMVMGCLLIERGLSPDDALYELNRLWHNCARSRDWPYVPETDEQIEYVRAWRARGAREHRAKPPIRVPRPATTLAHGTRERFIGALLGLAVGDALAAATQGRAPGTFRPATGLAGGGPDELPPGAWSDDTAMALCLAESLLERGGFDAHDQVARYERWRDTGHLSATGLGVGITPNTARALAMSQWRRQVFSGSHDPDQLDPEPLARVAPVAMFFFHTPEEAARQACDAARTTCQAPLVLDSCRLLATLLHAALAGASRPEILAAGRGLAASGELRDRVRALAEQTSRTGEPPATGTGESAIEVLEAALRAFARASSFEDGALRAVNVGRRSDVVGAVYGQIAGAHYGAASIPAPWRNGLIRKDLVEGFAERLFNHATSGAGR